ncbi:hypothetical protein DICPUDRAFT_146906 [Dictyostelium purpureum]|uniref:Non-structural maintenance of chromosomes element 4 n=1 Tax=Dictyostelium purpureum TaxID=5786 RepID=F0Z771_DICPU|nr:uncharacterized protein DICPUDRAFT_146906 [Dictyostelium purpureum]EGC40208.1 hypothetical protein DICPUDRAFT_146906 [Dictyostelium purpureum]|eukprot:XP_003283277.1 hypothetical protein DICPUDRAFT_146906 [Dictyostelium purpureum]
MVNNNQVGTTHNGGTANNGTLVSESQTQKRTLKEKQQSVGERRELRKEYRTLIQDVQASKNDLISPSSDGLLKTIKKTDQLYKNVHQAREAVLDSELLSLTSQYGLEQAQKFKVTLNSFDSIGFLTRIRDRLAKLSKDNDEDENENEDEDANPHDISTKGWDEFSKYFASHYSTLPVFDFMYGPINLEPPTEKKKAERKKNQKDDQPVGQVIRAENVTDTSQVETETTSSRVQCMKKYLEKKKSGIDFVDLVTDKHFSQTVENIFYFSFLLKDGHVRIKKENDLSIELTQPPEEKDYQSRDAIPSHAVVKLDYKTWEQFKGHSSQEFNMEHELNEFKKSQAQHSQAQQRPTKKSKH